MDSHNNRLTSVTDAGNVSLENQRKTPPPKADKEVWNEREEHRQKGNDRTAFNSMSRGNKPPKLDTYKKYLIPEAVHIAFALQRKEGEEVGLCFGKAGVESLHPDTSFVHNIKTKDSDREFILNKLEPTPTLGELFRDVPPDNFKEKFISSLIVVFAKNSMCDKDLAEGKRETAVFVYHPLAAVFVRCAVKAYKPFKLGVSIKSYAYFPGSKTNTAGWRITQN